MLDLRMYFNPCQCRLLDMQLWEVYVYITLNMEFEQNIQQADWLICCLKGEQKNMCRNFTFALCAVGSTINKSINGNVGSQMFFQMLLYMSAGNKMIHLQVGR